MLPRSTAELPVADGRNNKTTLLTAWSDLSFRLRRGGESGQLTALLRRSAEHKDGARVAFAQWAIETRDLATATVYPHGTVAGPASPLKLDEAWLVVTQETIDRQLARAGRRLALVLNDIAHTAQTPRGPRRAPAHSMKHLPRR